MKKIKFLIFLFIGVFFFIPKDTFALDYSNMSIVMFFSNGGSSTCNGVKSCSLITNTPVNRVSIKYSSYSLLENSKYELYTTIRLLMDRNTLGLNNTFYTGNYAGNKWNGASSVSWNNLDNVTTNNTGFAGGSNSLTWGLVQSFTSTVTSAGITFDFYFSSPTYPLGIIVDRFELLNTGNSTNDAINNSTNNIINNNNSNTNKIIENNNANFNKLIEEYNNQLEEQKKQTDLIKDTDTTDANEKASDFFDSFTSDSHGLSGIVTAPISFLQSLTASQCSPLTFTLPIVHNQVTLPCMKSIYQEYFGIFFSLWQLITTGLISYNVCLNFYKKVRDLQNPNNDRIEVLNL